MAYPTWDDFKQGSRIAWEDAKKLFPAGMIAGGAETLYRKGLVGTGQQAWEGAKTVGSGLLYGADSATAGLPSNVAPIPQIPQPDLSHTRGLIGEPVASPVVPSAADLHPGQFKARYDSPYGGSTGISGSVTPDVDLAKVLNPQAAPTYDAKYRNMLMEQSRQKEAATNAIFERQKAQAGLGQFAGFGPQAAQQQYRDLLEQRARPLREQQALQQMLAMQQLKNQGLVDQAAAGVRPSTALTFEQQKELQAERLSADAEKARVESNARFYAALARTDPALALEFNKMYGDNNQGRGGQAVAGDLNGDGKLSEEEKILLYSSYKPEKRKTLNLTPAQWLEIDSKGEALRKRAKEQAIVAVGGNA